MMINETKLQIPDEYKEKIQVIYKDKDGYWAYLGYGLCWKEKELRENLNGQLIITTCNKLVTKIDIPQENIYFLYENHVKVHRIL